MRVKNGILTKQYCLISFILLISAVFVLWIGVSPASAARKAEVQNDVSGLVNINNATQEDLENVKGLGAATAKTSIADKIKTKAKSAPEKLAPGTKININTADQTMLEKLPEIGPVKAKAIINGRPYNTIEDIMKVKRIKGKTFEAIKDYIVVK
ncbi:MAG: hypothetical protein APR62_03770 [Smithella sp. SDB]|nr:MAG: hypothetical protein APR62_03770 [Smithella sp. SDB]